MLPFSSPTAYGLGKSGWVTATFALKDAPPVDLLKAWIDESYRAQAPKKLIAQLDTDGGAPAKPPKTPLEQRASANPPAKRQNKKRAAR